jgi:hypothetical protein
LGFGGGGGVTRATGSPLRVIRRGCPVLFTSLKRRRQVALNFDIVIVSNIITPFPKRLFLFLPWSKPIVNKDNVILHACPLIPKREITNRKAIEISWAYGIEFGSHLFFK